MKKYLWILTSVLFYCIAAFFGLLLAGIFIKIFYGAFSQGSQSKYATPKLFMFAIAIFCFYAVFSIASDLLKKLKKKMCPYVNSVAFSPDGKYALSGSGDKTLKLWEVETGREIRSFQGHANSVNSVAFSPDGKYALSGSKHWREMKTLKLWEVETGREIHSFQGYKYSVNSVAFSPDGKYALSGGALSALDHRTVNLWEIVTGKLIHDYKSKVYYSVNSVAFSPDGKYVLFDSYNNVLKLWEVGTDRQVREFIRHLDSVTSVAFSPDGKYVLSGGADGKLKLWEVETGREIRSSNQ